MKLDNSVDLMPARFAKDPPSPLARVHSQLPGHVARKSPQTRSVVVVIDASAELAGTHSSQKSTPAKSLALRLRRMAEASRARLAGAVAWLWRSVS